MKGGTSEFTPPVATASLLSYSQVTSCLDASFQSVARVDESPNQIYTAPCVFTFPRSYYWTFIINKTNGYDHRDRKYRGVM